MTADLLLSSPLILAVLALLIDGLMGSKTLLGRLIGPDSLLFRLHGRLSKKLDREDRSPAELRLRGVLAFASVALIAGLLGGMLDRADSLFGRAMALLVLTLLLGQRTVFEMVFEVLKALRDPGHADAPKRFGATRWAVERLALRFADGLVANLAVFFAGGFAGLMVFRTLSMMMAAGAPSGLERPKSAYYDIPVALFRIVTALPAILASFLLATAILFSPHGQANSFKGLGTRAPGFDSLMSRRLALGSFAFGFDFNFRVHPDARGESSWIGPQDGKARLSDADLKRAIAAVTFAGILVFSLLVIPAGYLIVSFS